MKRLTDNDCDKLQLRPLIHWKLPDVMPGPVSTSSAFERLVGWLRSALINSLISFTSDLTSVWLILVSGIGYWPILASIGGYRYRPMVIWVSASIPVVLSFVYLSQQSTLLQVATHANSFKPIPYFHAYMQHTYITCTHLYPAQNHIFSTKNLYSQVRVSVSV